MAILTLSQTSCLQLLKCQFSLGKLYGGGYVHDELMFYCDSFGLVHYFWYEFALGFSLFALVVAV